MRINNAIDPARGQLKAITFEVIQPTDHISIRLCIRNRARHRGCDPIFGPVGLQGRFTGTFNFSG